MSTGLKPALINTYLNVGPRWSRALHRKLAALSSRRRDVFFYASAGDPYSFLVAQVLALLQASPRVPDFHVQLIPVEPIAATANPEPLLREAFALKDCQALATHYRDLSFDPAARRGDDETVALANRVLVASPRLETMLAVGAAIWGEPVPTAAHPTIQELASTLGAADGAVASKQISRNSKRQQRGGHYQAGTVRYFGEWFGGPLRGQSLARRLAEQDGASEDAAESVAWGAALVPGDVAGPEAVAATNPSLHFWMSFRSPYSYLAAARIDSWRRRGESVPVFVHPVLPMVMRGLAVPRAKKLYLVRDAAREAARLGIPFGTIADPLGDGARRCLAVCAEIVAGDHPGRLFPFAASALRGIWSEGLDVATDDGMVEVAERAGVARDEVWMALTNLAAGQGLAAAERKRLQQLGMWGVPTFAVGDFAIWGQDRLPLVRRALGLPPLNERPIR